MTQIITNPENNTGETLPQIEPVYAQWVQGEAEIRAWSLPGRLGYNPWTALQTSRLGSLPLGLLRDHVLGYAGVATDDAVTSLVALSEDNPTGNFANTFSSLLFTDHRGILHLIGTQASGEKTEDRLSKMVLSTGYWATVFTAERVMNRWSSLNAQTINVKERRDLSDVYVQALGALEASGVETGFGVVRQGLFNRTVDGVLKLLKAAGIDLAAAGQE